MRCNDRVYAIRQFAEGICSRLVAHRDESLAYKYPMLLSLCLLTLLLIGCSAPWNSTITRQPTPTPQFAGGEPLLPQLQHLYHDAPALPTTQASDDVSWSLSAHDASNTSAVIASTIHGRLLWFFQTPGPVLSSPVVANGLAIVNGGDGVLYAVDTTTGTLKWRTPVGDTLVAGTAAVADGVVYVAAQGHGLMALSLDTGTPLWIVDTRLPVRAAPLVVGAELFIADGANSLLCLDRASGKEYWEFKSEDVYANFWPTQGQPAVTADFGGRVFVGLGASTEFNALELRTGRKAWEQALDSRMVGSPVYDETAHLVFVATSSGHLYAMDAATGTVRWQDALSDDRSGLTASPAFANNTLYIGDNSGDVAALDAANGHPRWTYFTGSAIVASPVVHLAHTHQAQDIYIVEQQGDVLSLDASRGTPEWQRPLGELRSAPALVGQMLFIGSLAGHGLFALT